jgi:hypothetical protein
MFPTIHKTKQLEKSELIEKIIKLNNNDDVEYKLLLTKWSKNRLIKKISQLEILQEKGAIIEELRLYGDSYSNMGMNIKTLKLNLEYTRENATKQRITERMEMISLINGLSKSVPYTVLMVESIKELRDRYNLLEIKNKKKNLINDLQDMGYTKKYLQNISIDELNTMSQLPEPVLTPYNNNTTRKDLIDILVQKNIWTLKTINGWNTEQLKAAFNREMQKNYGPLAESIPKRLPPNKREHFEFCRRNKTRHQYLLDISNSLFYEITE